MRWLLDQGLPRGVVRILSDLGHDVVHVGDIGMAKAADSEIIALGVSERRIVVTLDADFHLLLALSGADQPSVIRIREERLKSPEIAAILLAIYKGHSSSLLKGCVMVYAHGMVRSRKLPILG